MDIELFRLARRLLVNGVLSREVALFLLEAKLLQLREREMVKGAGFGDTLHTVETALAALERNQFPEEVFLSFKSILEKKGEASKRCQRFESTLKLYQT
jgi:hypothetical protein